MFGPVSVDIAAHRDYIVSMSPVNPMFRRKSHETHVRAGIPTGLADDVCWPWTKGQHTQGYGRCWDTRVGKVRYAHRLVYELLRGPIPDDLDILHSCDNPPCVNPAHLRIGTHRENMIEKVEKGRANFNRGESAGQAKLTESAVLDIRARVAAGETQHALAREYGVSQVAVCFIVKRKTWKHV